MLHEQNERQSIWLPQRHRDGAARSAMLAAEKASRVAKMARVGAIARNHPAKTRRFAQY
jgi:hypothetical protein